MQKLPRLAAHLTGIVRKRKMFWRILLLYLVGCVALLSVFSAVTTRLLTEQAIRESISRNRDALGQAYGAADYVLNTIYDRYYKLYQSYEVSQLMFGSTDLTSQALAVSSLFNQLDFSDNYVASVYLLNLSLDRVYDTDGRIDTPENFADSQAMRLFKFYNESSNTLFLPRTVSLPDESGRTVQHNYITLIFSRRNAVSIPMGGLIVNMDESRLIDLITRDLESPESIYVISENGSILANSDADRVNTSIYGSDLWEQIQQYSGREDFSFQVDFGGTPCLVTGRSAPRLRFYFLRITPVAQLEQSVAYIRNLVFACAVLFLLLALMMSMAASRFIYRPISRLVTNLHGRVPPPKFPSAPAPMDELAFLDTTYRTLFDEVETLSHDNQLLARSQRREVLSRLFYGEYPTEQKCREEAARQGLLADAGGYLPLVLLFDDYQSLSRERTPQDLALIRYALCNIAEELLGRHAPACCAEMAPDQVAVLLQLTEPALPPWLREALAAVNAAMQQHLHCGISCGIGTLTTDLMGLTASYNDAMTAIGYRLVLGYGAVIDYAEIEVRQTITPEYPLDTDAAIVQALRNRSEEKARAELNRFFSGFALANVDVINMAITQLTISLSRTVHSLASGHEGTRQLPSYRMLRSSLDACDTLDRKKALITDYCCQVIQIRSSEVHTKRETLVESIREFIETNYANPMLNTDDIAEFADLSPNYLRTVFKGAVGKSPIDYLTDYRIERAKELLASTDISTKEIAAAVGYYNHRYFYSVFKSKTGLTTTAYRTAQRGRTASHQEEEPSHEED